MEDQRQVTLLWDCFLHHIFFPWFLSVYWVINSARTHRSHSATTPALWMRSAPPPVAQHHGRWRLLPAEQGLDASLGGLFPAHCLMDAQ